MSDAIFKASLRQTLAYIEAYNADLLRAIETDFKDALQCPDERDEVRGEVEGVQHGSASEECPGPLQSPSRVSSAPRRSRAETDQAELRRLPDWHFQLPFVAATVATILLLFAR